MTDAIMSLLKSINDSIVNLSASSALTGGMNSFSGKLYQYILTIQSNVALPIAYVILSLFCVLALYEVSIRTEHIGSNTMGVELVVSLLIKLSICIWAIDNCPTILNAIYDVTVYFTNQVQQYLSMSSMTGFDLDALEEAIDSLSFWSKFLALIVMFITNLIVQIAVKMAQIIVIARFVELYLYFCVAPIPVATLPSGEMSQIGKNFLKSFAAVCLQGTLIYLVLSFFPFIADFFLEGSDNFLVIAGNMIGYAILLIVAVWSTQKWAKSICNAM